MLRSTHHTPFCDNAERKTCDKKFARGFRENLGIQPARGIDFSGIETPGYGSFSIKWRIWSWDRLDGRLRISFRKQAWQAVDGSPLQARADGH
jgi:hypothetical protein